jgi:two-component system chemotaxis response regulator CheY
VRVLIVDDSKAMRMILRRMLVETGFEVLEASGAKEALATFDKGRAPDLILLDWTMPEMNGIQFLAHIRSHNDWGDVKVLMVTSESQPQSVERALAAGANEYMMKPFTKEILEEKLLLLGVKAV